MISARIIADSVEKNNPLRPRLTTFVLKYPRFIHAEFMTHSTIRKNAASSRAIPTKTMLKMVIDDPATPVWWGKNQAGMQAKESLAGWRLKLAKFFWLNMRYPVVAIVWLLNVLNLHKQIANRLLEPWLHIEVIATGTSASWMNLYALRDHKDAQPEFQELARAMLAAHRQSVPEALLPGEWHLPFVRPYERPLFVSSVELWKEACQISSARCARISYLKQDKTDATTEENVAMFNRLMAGDVKHASPTEHQGQVPIDGVVPDGMESPLAGWIQFRKTIKDESVNIKNVLRIRPDLTFLYPAVNNE